MEVLNCFSTGYSDNFPRNLQHNSTGSCITIYFSNLFSISFLLINHIASKVFFNYQKLHIFLDIWWGFKTEKIFCDISSYSCSYFNLRNYSGATLTNKIQLLVENIKPLHFLHFNSLLFVLAWGLCVWFTTLTGYRVNESSFGDFFQPALSTMITP